MNDIHTQHQVAYLGPAGTYTHTALLTYFGSTQRCLPVAEIPDVFVSVEKGECEYGIVPVENSTQGSVTVTLDYFSQSDLSICGEVMLRIHHCLLQNKQTKELGFQKQGFQKIVSHQQSLGQCRLWLNENYPDAELVSVSSNAEAARIAANETGVAAIAGETAAELYKLEILSKNIEDTHDNTTRFWILNRNNKSSATGQDKTSIIISTHNEAGTLLKALEPFQRFGVSLSKLESRPSRKEAWSYSFYVDIEGHIDDPKVQSAMAELKEHSLDVKVLGSYPVATAV